MHTVKYCALGIVHVAPAGTLHAVFSHVFYKLQHTPLYKNIRISTKYNIDLDRLQITVQISKIKDVVSVVSSQTVYVFQP